MTAWIALECIFLAGLVTSNLIAPKMISAFGLTFTVGALTYPLTFLATDIYSELKGERSAHTLVWKGFLVNVLVIGLLRLLLAVPESSASDMQEAMSAIFTPLPRILAASMVAYLVSQHIDVVMFHFWKRQTADRHLWLRNNASTVVSQFVDTVLFVGIGFSGLLEPRELLSMGLGQYLLKVGLAFLDTPLCYLGVSWLKRHGQ